MISIQLLNSKKLLLSFSSPSFFKDSCLAIMLAAVKEGDAKKLAELIRQDPGFKVNVAVDENGDTLLHFACIGDRGSVIPLLLAHPDIDVNVKNKDGWTSFFRACLNGYASSVREMLKDPGSK